MAQETTKQLSANLDKLTAKILKLQQSMEGLNRNTQKYDDAKKALIRTEKEAATTADKLSRKRERLTKNNKNHKNSIHNPYAQYQKEFTMEEIMESRMISWPNTMLMCCPTGDGAGAVIYASAEKARQSSPARTSRRPPIAQWCRVCCRDPS